VADLRLARRAAGLSTAFPGSHFPSELDDGVIAFDSGFAASDLLPDLTPFAQIALNDYRAETLQYSAGQGQPLLREWIADLMNRDGCMLTAQNLLIVNGAKNGLDLISRLLLEEGDAIVVTAPMYFTAIPIFGVYGVEFIEIGQDEAGIRIDELEAALARRAAEGLAPPKLIYNVADFHNPSGVTMPLNRRRALVELAARHGIAVIEDTPYRRVRFDGEAVPSLKALDTHGIVLHVGTFSKLVAPEVRVQVPDGGYYLWLTLPVHVDGDRLAADAEAAGINLIAGSRFFAGTTTGNRAPPRNHVRLSYSFATPDTIDAGITRLAAVYRAMTAR